MRRCDFCGSETKRLVFFMDGSRCNDCVEALLLKAAEQRERFESYFKREPEFFPIKRDKYSGRPL